MPLVFLQKLIDRFSRQKKFGSLSPHHADLVLVQRAHARTFPKFEQIRNIGRIATRQEMWILRASIVVFFAAFIWLVVSIILHFLVAVPAVGGKYTEGVVGSIQLPNPIFGSSGDTDDDLIHLVYNGLMRISAGGNIVPDLASSYSMSQDKKTYTFTLRDNVLWHDGEPLTSRDVVTTFDAIQNPKTESPLFISFRGVSVVAVDDRTVRFELKEPFAPFLSTLTVGILPAHIWETVAPERMRLSKYTLAPVGTGPYMVSKFVKDASGFVSRYELIRNPRYFHEAPYIQNFIFQFFSDYEGSSGAIQALREGKIDGLSFVPNDLKDRVQRKHITLHTLELPQYTALFFNPDNAPFLKEAYARKALEMALPKARILHEVLKGEGSLSTGPLLPGFPGYSGAVTTTPYLPDEANALLDTITSKVSVDEYRSARTKTLLTIFSRATSTAPVATSTGEIASTSAFSAVSSSTGSAALMNEVLSTDIHPAQTFYRKAKDGSFLTLRIVTADTPEYRQVAGLVTGFWQEIGVKTDVTFVNPADMSEKVLKKRDYDVLLYGVVVGSDPDQYPFWHSSQIDFPGLNFSRYRNSTVDALLVSARAATSTETIAFVDQKIQDIILSDRPAIFLYTPIYAFATTDAVEGIPDMKIFEPSDRLLSVTQWYVKTKWRF